MGLLKIAQIGHPVLRAKASPVVTDDIKTDKIQTLIDNMVETMRDAIGAGIAAPQVHCSLRICTVEVNANPRYPDAPPIPLHVFINPQIIEQSGEIIEDWEGCLSIPDLKGRVPRYKTIKVQAFDRDGQLFSIVAGGFFARAIQHEVDHLDGLMYVDRMPNMLTLTRLDEYRKFWMTSDKKAPVGE